MHLEDGGKGRSGGKVRKAGSCIKVSVQYAARASSIVRGTDTFVKRTVAVTDVIPRLGIIPLGLFDWLERFYSYVA